MSVCLLLIGDGRRDYRARTLESLVQAVDMGGFSDVVEIDDSDHRLGFCGAVQAGWDLVLQTGADYVAHVELDFTFRAEVPLDRMIGVLEREQHLAQLVLKRQPWNPDEIAAGGIVEQHPDDFVERRDGPDVWTEQRRYWSTNPSVYSTRYCRMRWPQERRSEGIFTHQLLADPHLKFGLWGGKFDAPLVEHIGEERSGRGY